ncbi:unnamed protein product [Linum trigynum]
MKILQSASCWTEGSSVAGVPKEEREANVGVSKSNLVHVTTTVKRNANKKESNGPPPGFGTPRATLGGQFQPMKEATCFSPYKPRQLFKGHESRDEEEGQENEEYAAWKEAITWGPNPLGPLLPLYNPLLGQQAFYSSSKYLNMLQENMSTNQAHSPYLIWNNNQIGAQYLST